jgi:hypothetical protein
VDRGGGGVKGGDDLDILAEEACEHFAGFEDEFVEVEGAGLGDLLAADGEELAGEAGSAAAGEKGGDAE